MSPMYNSEASYYTKSNGNKLTTAQLSFSYEARKRICQILTWTPRGITSHCTTNERMSIIWFGWFAEQIIGIANTEAQWPTHEKL